MTLLLAGLLGGGYYAYRLGVVPPTHSADAEGKGTTGGAEEGHGTSGEKESKNDTGTTAEGRAQSQSAPPMAGEGTQGNKAAPQGSAQNGAEESQNQSSGQVQGSEAQTQALSAAQGDAAHGQEIYSASCQGCHGADAGGAVGPRLAGQDNAAGWEFTKFATAVRKGVVDGGRELNTTMPRYEGTPIQPTGKPPTDQDLADIQAYLLTLK